MVGTNLSFDETQAYKLSEQLAAVLTDITCTSFPEHKWGVFGGLESYEVRLIGAQDGKGHTEKSELPQKKYHGFIAALNNAGIREYEGADEPAIKKLKIFLESATRPDYVRLAIGHINPRYEDGEEAAWSLSPYAADVAFLQGHQKQIKEALERQMGIAVPQVKGDFASAAVDGCQKAARSVAGGMKRLGKFVRVLRQ